MSDNTNNGFPVPEEPLTREEQYLSAIAGVTEATEIPEIPLTRVEAYLNKIVEEGGDITDKLEAGTNIVIEETADGKAKISASGEVSSEDTYARGEIQAILDGTTIDSFGDVEIALADKVDKVEGKGLSANDFTDTLKTKLDGIAAGAEVNVQADWNQTTDTADDYIKNKPTIPAAQVNSDWNAASGVAQILNKPTLGTAAAAATTDFATAAQGTKADSAIQGVKVGSTTLTPDSGKAVTITKNDITGLGIPAQDTTYEFESTYNASTNKAATMADIKNGVLTGYAQSSGNVAATDKVIEAIGKVEKKADTNESNISTYAIPTCTDTAFTSSSTGVYEYTGISFTVPSGEVWEFFVADKYNGSGTTNFSNGLLVSDSSSAITNVSVIAENTQAPSVSGISYWVRQLTGLTPKRANATTYYVWTNRAVTTGCNIFVCLRRVF